MAVDDDPGVLAAIQRDLRSKYGDEYRVLGADSGQRALDMLEQLKQRGDPVALFLVDQRMPGMTGVEFLEKTVEAFPDAKKALLTAYADTDVAIRAINTVGMDHYLLKPWDPPDEQLYPVLSDLLEDWKANYRAPFEGVTVVCDRWTPASHEVKDFLARNQVPFRWLDIESNPDAEAALMLAGLVSPKMPVLIFPDGAVLEEPTTRQIAETVGLRTEAERPFYDVIIVGGGPAGLSAAVYAAAAGLRALVMERDAPGGQAGMSARIENYLGFPVGLSGSDLARRAVAQVERLGAELLSTEEAQELIIGDSHRGVTLRNGSELGAHAVVIATGVEYHRLEQPGIDDFTGAGVYYGAAMTEGQSVKGEDIFIVGGANSAGQATLYFAQFARNIRLLIRADSIGVSMAQYLIDRITAAPNVTVMEKTEILEARGDGHLEEITVVDKETGMEEIIAGTAMFIFIGAKPATEWVAEYVARDEHGFILAGPDLLAQQSEAWPLERDPMQLETSVPGVFVAGDVRHGSMKRVVTAVNEGGMAISYVQDRLSSLEY